MAIDTPVVPKNEGGSDSIENGNNDVISGGNVKLSGENCVSSSGESNGVQTEIPQGATTTSTDLEAGGASSTGIDSENLITAAKIEPVESAERFLILNKDSPPGDISPDVVPAPSVEKDASLQTDGEVSI